MHAVRAAGLVTRRIGVELIHRPGHQGIRSALRKRWALFVVRPDEPVGPFVEPGQQALAVHAGQAAAELHPREVEAELGI